MKVVQVQVPDQLDEEIKGLLKAGWFASTEEIVRLALVEFVRRHRFELLEQFQREDIAWALHQKGIAG